MVLFARVISRAITTFMLTMRIPYEFIAGLLEPSWSDIHYGLDHQLISSAVAIDLATARVSRNPSVSAGEIALAGLPHEAPVLDTVKELASAEGVRTIAESRSRWLYLALAWIYENRGHILDSLSLVEEVYEDFDHPEEIDCLIRYKPMAGADLGSREKNEARMYEHWKAYLNQSARRFHEP